MNNCKKINLSRLILFVFLILLVFTLTGCLASEENKTYKTTKKKDVDLATIEQAKNTIQSFFISYQDGNSKEMRSLLVGKAADEFNGKLDAIPYDYDITKAKELASGLFSFEVTVYFKGGTNGSYSEDWTYKVAAKTDKGYMRIYERNQKKSTTPVNLKDLVITLERTPCFGACPTYKLTIKGSGVVIYEGKASVKVKGKRISMMSKDKVKELVSEFEKIDYFSLKNNYDKLTATDMPSAYTSIIIDGKKKSVSHYHGDNTAPKPLTKLENKIDEFAKTDKWIGKD